MLHLENGRRRRRQRRGVDFALYLGDWRYVRDELGVDPAGLLQKAEEKAAEYGVPDPGEAICLALRHVRRHHDRTRGAFEPLFLVTLEERLRKGLARAKGKAVNDWRRVLDHLKAAPGPGARAEDFRRWSDLLYELACRGLGDRVRKALEVYRGGGGVKQAARALGLAPQSVKNGYGKERLVRLVKGAVAKLVGGLEEPQRQALLRHLRREAGFTRREVAGLLQVDLGEPEDGPVLEEDALLETLGWAEPASRKSKGRKDSANGRGAQKKNRGTAGGA